MLYQQLGGEWQERRSSLKESEVAMPFDQAVPVLQQQQEQQSMLWLCSDF